MGSINLPAVFLGAAAFFAVGMVWYGALFGKVWQRELGLSEEQLKQNLNMPLIFALCFLFELLIAVTFGHLIARTGPSPHVIMMMALGFGATIMAPAIGINYLSPRKSGLLFAIDAGHFVVGMAALGAVFVALS
jgi:hypothetical protein